jgi:hypothetical protein
MLMPKTILIRALGVLLPAALLPTFAWGQRPTFGPILTQILSSGAGVARDCVQREYGTGLGGRFSVPVLTRLTAVQVAARAYGISRRSECVDGFPPPDGTYIQDDRINLLSRSFVTTDVRLATGSDEIPVTLAAGGGNAWHEGHNLPYVVLAAGLTLLDRPDVQLGLESELQWLRVTSDRFRRTYQNFTLVAEEPLGRVHQWSHAFSLGITVDIPL